MTETAPPSTAPHGTAPHEIALTVNGEPRRTPATTTLAELVASVSAANTGVAAALNEAVVPRSSWSATALSPGDRIEILTAVQGG
ncbi:sulfur carrier protein ThiS [Streptomyces sp. CBMA156]|uniref:sulfur carrier protein ThiS n=1 Tax=Streptomyces sp. CBMA156 TaxID=1930280 RepID=UPI0016620487|nr:sulfur carrier protein ThiS [Streptomyces sp. CBMA156]MBD0675860.1 thiamine biosynthesis protein ThiS [Streptomyces sp. CBMA156]